MTKVIMRKEGIGASARFVPDEDEAAEVLARIPEGTCVVVEAYKPRGENGLYQLRKWWKLMSILAENMPVFAADRRHASDMVLIACHECDWRVNPLTGEVTPQARSLALERMEDDVFERLWRRALF